MKSVDEWIKEFMDAPSSDSSLRKSIREQVEGRLREMIPQIQQDAVSSMPPLADLRITTEALDKITEKADRYIGNLGSVPCLFRLSHVMDLIEDHKTMLRMLEDCWADGTLDKINEIKKKAYDEGYNAAFAEMKSVALNAESQWDSR